jgi:predicted house-cleaning NTP pyrophosphatase (Maf/HAM1 superfamily)
MQARSTHHLIQEALGNPDIMNIILSYDKGCYFDFRLTCKFMNNAANDGYLRYQLQQANHFNFLNLPYKNRADYYKNGSCMVSNAFGLAGMAIAGGGVNLLLGATAGGLSSVLGLPILGSVAGGMAGLGVVYWGGGHLLSDYLFNGLIPGVFVGGVYGVSLGFPVGAWIASSVGAGVSCSYGLGGLGGLFIEQCETVAESTIVGGITGLTTLGLYAYNHFKNQNIEFKLAKKEEIKREISAELNKKLR